MARKICFLVVIALALSVSAQAQGITDKVDLFGGYSFMHAGTKPSFNTNGWEISAQYKVKPWLGVAGDIDGHYGTFEGVSTNTHNYLIGPQVSWSARVSPFAHVLVGGAQFKGAGQTSTSVAYGFGFGIDTRVAPQIAWRIIQLDVIHSHAFNAPQSNTRLSTGIVFHF
jgi:opacity protein-like surface antigen